MPSMVAAARFTARPTASSIELVDVPVSVIVFSTIEVSSRERLAALALVALAAPVRAVNVDPSADGPFAVGVATLAFADAARGRSLITELWYPARAAGRAAPVRRGRYPLVLVAHGYCGFRTNYEFLSV